MEAALESPRAVFGTWEQYPTLTAKGAVLFYHVIKDHPCPTGNKRLAVILLVVFLEINGFSMTASDGEVYEAARRVGESDAAARLAELHELTEWLDRTVVLALEEGGDT